jgi:hypothetical protein
MRFDDNIDDVEAGFLDVAANALAIMILATMMLLVVSAPIVVVGDYPQDDSAEIKYPHEIDLLTRPFYSYYFVSESGIASIDLDAIAQAITVADGDASTDQGKIYIIVDRQSRRDWNEYRAKFMPNYEYLSKNSLAFNDQQLSLFINELSDFFDSDNVSPTFFVLPDGIERVAPIYWALRGKGVPVRWYPIAYGNPILFERSSRLFELPGVLD